MQQRQKAPKDNKNNIVDPAKIDNDKRIYCLVNRAKKAQQKAQDPIVQMQQQELALKQGELQRKIQKDQTDAKLEEEKIRSDANIEGAKLGVELAKQEKELTEKQKVEGIKLGLQISKGE